MKNARLQLTAAHEAGHAVVARRFGLQVSYATIIPNPVEGTLGHVSYSGDYPTSAPFPSRALLGGVLADLAGPLTQRVMQTYFGMPCYFCNEVDCADLAPGWPARCIEKRQAKMFLRCDGFDCDRCDPWPTVGHPSLIEAMRYLDPDEAAAWMAAMAEQCFEMLGNDAVLRAIDAVKDELMAKKTLTGEDLDRLDPYDFRFAATSPDGQEFEFEPDEADSDEWYVNDLLTRAAPDIALLDDSAL